MPCVHGQLAGVLQDDRVPGEAGEYWCLKQERFHRQRGRFVLTRDRLVRFHRYLPVLIVYHTRWGGTSRGLSLFFRAVLSEEALRRVTRKKDVSLFVLRERCHVSRRFNSCHACCCLNTLLISSHRCTDFSSNVSKNHLYHVWTRLKHPILQPRSPYGFSDRIPQQTDYSLSFLFVVLKR